MVAVMLDVLLRTVKQEVLPLPQKESPLQHAKLLHIWPTLNQHDDRRPLQIVLGDFLHSGGHGKNGSSA